MIKLLLHKDTDKCLASGFVKYREAKGIVYANNRFTRCIRVCEGVNMEVQIPLLIIDRKEFWVMSAHYRTCGVTRLRIITLLSTSMNRDEREIYRKCFGIFEIVSEDENGNVPYYFLWAAHLELFRVGGSHISVTWMHAKVPHFVYMASEWIVHMACEWVVF